MSVGTTSTRKIKVCHVMTADLWAGAEVQVATVASHLVRRSDVDLSAVLLNEGRLADELRRLGVPVTVVDERRTSAVGIFAFLLRFLRDHQVDIVHTHRYKDSVLGIVAAKLAGVPRAMRTVHGLSEPTKGWDRLKSRVYETLETVTLRCFADCVVAVSRRMAETLTQSGYRSTVVTPIHNGIDPAVVKTTRPPEDVRRELGIETRDVVIGTAGRLSAVKGHACLLRAVRLILDREPNARFVLAGDGPLRDELLAAARRLGVDRRCLFVGPRADVYDVIAAMDVFVLPSLAEGLPMVLLEAMVLGTPVVATAVGGIPELITHDENGVLVEPGSEQALADACLALARDRDRARALASRAKQVVGATFSHEKSGGAVAAVYRRLAGRADGAAGPDRTRTRVSDLARRLRDDGRRRLRHGIERRRMNRLRQDPARVMAALTSAKSVLIVCHGNIIRSVFAARLLAQALGDAGRVSIASAGLGAVPGRPPHPTAVLTATARRVDLSQHSAARVEAESVAKADVIFVMDLPQLALMRARFPEARHRTFLLTCLASDTPLEVPDPVDGDEARFRACFDHIARAVGPIVRVLSAPGARA
jgi:glycosyltransferase involved in cell wall biosynthesis/protein-tyrosine-phosphatase